MAVYNWSAGTVSGKFGGMVGTSWKGLPVLKSYTKPKQPETEAQRKHKQNFKRLITISNALCKNWLPSVFTEDALLTFSNQFIKQNRDIFHVSLNEWELKMNGSFSFPNPEKANEEKSNDFYKFSLQGFENLPISQIKKYIFAIYFLESNSFFYEILEDFPQEVSLNFGKSFENCEFFQFEQVITANGVSFVSKSFVSNW